MAKKDISTILTKGTAKQRANLVAEHIARLNYYETSKEPLLTDAEYNKLSDSFKTPAEIKLWNKFRSIDSGIKIGLNNLQGLLFELKMHYSDLRGYILVWNTIEASELISNSILHQLTPEERLRVSSNLKDNLKMFFTQIEPDEEGYLEYKIDFERQVYRDENGKPISYKDEPRMSKEFTLLYAMNNIKGFAEDTATKFFSWRKALLDYMGETGFNPETYKNLIKKFTEDAYTNVIGWDKYLSISDTFMKLDNPFLDKHKFRYNITPDLTELEINEDEYNWFKKSIGGDE